MKKNPIDDLFSRKLREAELTPRAEAWEKLQMRQQTKQRRAVWIQWGPWLAAAGVSLLLIAGWLSWKDEAVSPTNTQMAQNTTKNPSVNSLSKPVQNQAVDIEFNKRQVVVQVEGKSVVAESKNNIENEQQVIQTTAPQIAQTVPQVAQEAKPSVESGLPTVETTTAVAQATPSVEPKPTEKKVVLQLPDLTEMERVASTMTPNESVTTSTELEADFLNKPRKTSKMAKVWQQLKNAKSGEKVDWDEVGFNPNKLIAKATGKKETNEK